MRKDLIQFENKYVIPLYNYLRNEGINYIDETESKHIATREAKILYEIIISNQSNKELKAGDLKRK